MLGRMPDLLDVLIRNSVRRVAETDWDIVITSYAPRYCHEVGYQLKRARKNCYWIADYRDLWSDHHQFKGLKPFTYLENYIDKKYQQAADLVTTVSEGMRVNLAKHAQDTLVVTNGFSANANSAVCYQPFCDDDLVRMVYTGTTYPRWGSFKHFLEAINLCIELHPWIEQKLEVIFIGRDLANLQDRTRALGIDHIVKFHGIVESELSLAAQRQASVLLFFDPDENPDIPTGKIYEYLGSGSHTWRIGPDIDTAAMRLLRTTKRGSDLGNCPAKIADSIREGVENPRKFKKYTQDDLVTQYERRTVASHFLERVEAKMANRGPALRARS